MIVYTLPAIIPILLATGAYFLFGLFLDDINAFGVAAIVGAGVSALMEFSGLRGTLFFIPVGAWLGFVAVAQAFDFFTIWRFKGEPGIAFTIMAIISVVLGVASIVGLFAGGPREDEVEPG